MGAAPAGGRVRPARHRRQTRRPVRSPGAARPTSVDGQSDLCAGPADLQCNLASMGRHPVADGSRGAPYAEQRHPAPQSSVERQRRGRSVGRRPRQASPTPARSPSPRSAGGTPPPEPCRRPPAGVPLRGRASRGPSPAGRQTGAGNPVIRLEEGKRIEGWYGVGKLGERKRSSKGK